MGDMDCQREGKSSQQAKKLLKGISPPQICTIIYNNAIMAILLLWFISRIMNNKHIYGISLLIEIFLVDEREWTQVHYLAPLSHNTQNIQKNIALMTNSCVPHVLI